MLTREGILEAADLPRKALAVPEWGGDVFVIAMDGTRRDALDADLDKHRDGDGRIKSLAVYRTIVAIHTVVDDTGSRIFTMDDMPRLLSKSSRALERIAAVSNHLNGLTSEEVEAMVKNCEHPHGLDNGSSSPADGDAQ